MHFQKFLVGNLYGLHSKRKSSDCKAIAKLAKQDRRKKLVGQTTCKYLFIKKVGTGAK